MSMIRAASRAVSVACLMMLVTHALVAHAAGADAYDQRAQMEALMLAEQAFRKGDAAGARKIAESVMAAAQKADPDAGGDERVMFMVMSTYRFGRQWDDWERAGQILLRQAERKAQKESAPEATLFVRSQFVTGYLMQERFADAERVSVQIIQSANEAVKKSGFSMAYRELEILAKQFASRGKDEEARLLARAAANFRKIKEAD